MPRQKGLSLPESRELNGGIGPFQKQEITEQANKCPQHAKVKA